MENLSSLLESMNCFQKKSVSKLEFMGADGARWCKNCNTPKQEEVILCNGEYALIPKRCACEETRYLRECVDTEDRIKREQTESMRRALIGVESYRSYTFKNDDGASAEQSLLAKQYVEKYSAMKERGKGLLFWGDIGTGKTFMAMCIANALIERGISARCVTLAEVVAMMSDWDNAARNFSRLMASSLIVVDDLGTQRDNDFANEQIFKFIDGCYVRKIPMVITTNYTPTMLEKTAEDTAHLAQARIYSRILERCIRVKLNDEKRRQTSPQANKAELLNFINKELI